MTNEEILEVAKDMVKGRLGADGLSLAKDVSSCWELTRDGMHFRNVSVTFPSVSLKAALLPAIGVERATEFMDALKAETRRIRMVRAEDRIASALRYIDGPTMGLNRQELRDILEGRLGVDGKGKIVE